MVDLVVLLLSLVRRSSSSSAIPLHRSSSCVSSSMAMSVRAAIASLKRTSEEPDLIQRRKCRKITGVSPELHEGWLKAPEGASSISHQFNWPKLYIDRLGVQARRALKDFNFSVSTSFTGYGMAELAAMMIAREAGRDIKFGAAIEIARPCQVALQASFGCDRCIFSDILEVASTKSKVACTVGPWAVFM